MKRIAAIAVGVGLALAAGGAQAGPYTPAAYGFAENLLSDLTVMAAKRGVLTSGASGASSTDGARYGEAPPSGHARTGSLSSGLDIREATSGPGPFPGQDVTARRAGYHLGMAGARADADILRSNPFSARGVTQSVVAEGELPSGGAAVEASAALDWSWMEFCLSAPTRLALSFKDDVALVAAAAAGATARAGTKTEVAIYDSKGHKVFAFAPDGGGPGAILGGHATADPFDLQGTIGAYPGNGGMTTAGNDWHSDLFAAVTDTLPAGTYRIAFSTFAFQRAIDAPEPAAAGILVAGLAGLGWVRRRRRS